MSLESSDKINSSISILFESICADTLKKLILSLSQKLAIKEKIDQNEIVNIWNDVAPEYNIIVPEETEVGVCIYKFKTGKNANNACGKNSSSKSVTGKYCSKHIKEEDKPEATQKVSKSAKPTDKDTKKIVISPRYDNKLELWIDKQTGYVVHKDKNIAPIYAKLIDEELNPLTEEDVTLLKTYNYDYDESLFEKLYS